MREDVTIDGKDTQEEYYHCYMNSCPESHPYTVTNDKECYDACSAPLVGPLTGTVCTDKCGLYQELDAKRKCVCKEKLEMNAKGTECVLPVDKNWKDFKEICAAEDRVVSFTGDKCTESCQENETSDTNKVCICDELSIQHEDDTRCVKKAECARKVMKDGVPICLAKEICTGKLKLSREDEQLCVTSCDIWTDDTQSGELCCVDTCPGWWYSSEDGLCVEEKWRKSTAIAVPVIVVVILAGIVLTIVIIRKKTKAKAAKKEPEKEMRDHVTNA